jgi:hypothetical protein
MLEKRNKCIVLKYVKNIPNGFLCYFPFYILTCTYVYLPVREDVSPGNKIKGLFNPG